MFEKLKFGFLSRFLTLVITFYAGLSEDMKELLKVAKDFITELISSKFDTNPDDKAQFQELERKYRPIFISVLSKILMAEIGLKKEAGQLTPIDAEILEGVAESLSGINPTEGIEKKKLI